MTRKNRIILVLAGLGLLAILISLTWTASPDGKLSWLTPAELNLANRRTLAQKLRNSLVTLTPPPLRHYWNVQTSIRIQSSIFILPTQSVAELELAAPMATNTVGARAWLLSASNWSALNQHLQKIPDCESLGRPQIQTYDGGRGQLTSLGKTSQLTLDVNPGIAPTGVNLLLGLTLSVPPPPDGSAGTQTNLAIACRILVPKADMLVIDFGNGTLPLGKSYLFITTVNVTNSSATDTRPVRMIKPAKP